MTTSPARPAPSAAPAPSGPAGRTGRVSPLAGQVAAGRELAVLGDGPWAPRWYWRDDLEAMQRAGRRYPDGHPAAELRRYQPTDQHREHPTGTGAPGRVWRYRIPVPGQRGATS